MQEASTFQIKESERADLIAFSSALSNWLRRVADQGSADGRRIY
jgi:hypothetical protein